jgi:protein O-mannosyl-transferase
MFATLVLATGYWAWTSGLSGPFQFDDGVTPLGDPASQSLAAWQQYLPLTLRPVTKLSYALEAEAGIAFEPAPRRLVSILFHALTAALLLLLIAQLASPVTLLLAAFLAVLWFVHPVHADSVLMLSGRSAVLSTAFLLAALLALERCHSWWAALLFVIACLSRETALAGLLPLGVLAASRPAATLRVVLRQIAPLLIGAAVVALWILTTPRYLHLAEFSFLGRPFWSSVASQVGAVPVGLWLLFNPAALSIDYGIPLPTKALEPLFLLGLGMYLAAVAGIFRILRRSRAAAIGLALWLAALLPTQSFIPKLDALSNRPLSLALAGLLLFSASMLAATLNWLRARPAGLGGKWTALQPAPGVPAGTFWLVDYCVVALFLFFTTATASRSELFQSDLSLWQDAASKSLTNARPHLQYAVLLKRAGRDREAWDAISAARSIDPFSADIATMSRTFHFKEVPQ